MDSHVPRARWAATWACLTARDRVSHVFSRHTRPNGDAWRGLRDEAQQSRPTDGSTNDGFDNGGSPSPPARLASAREVRVSVWAAAWRHPGVV